MDKHLDKPFAGKAGLVTGAASGIGKATAIAFARLGAKVLVSDVQVEAGKVLVDEINGSGGEAIFFACDVAREDQVAAMVEKAEEHFERLDFACNNAGIEPQPAEAAEIEPSQWQRILDVNLTGTWLCMKHEIPWMLEQGGGSIVNVASIAGVVGFASSAAYVASKHGVLGLTRTAALDYAKKGIRVNAVCPGVIHTPMIDRFTHGDAAANAQLAAGAPMGRMGRPEEIATAVVWLCSEGASYVTGHPLVVDGGWVVQ